MLEKLLIGAIRLYQKTLSPDRGLLGRMIPHPLRTCAFYPSCSEYGILAIKKYGSMKGLYLLLFRILRCHPWAIPKVDHP